jgi:16S rRNA (guanine527-N7)-methyltransferase
MLATPGLTAIDDAEEAWRQHVEDSLAAVPHVARVAGEVVDVGSGGGAPGIPLAVGLPGREVTLLEASGRKCDFLRAATACLPNVRVVHGRAEEQPADSFGVAVAKALAPPPVALEWCLPLVAPGGTAILFVSADTPLAPLATVAALIGGGRPELVAAGPGRALAVAPKLEPTPAGFPRRPGMARKRPLA